MRATGPDQSQGRRTRQTKLVWQTRIFRGTGGPCHQVRLRGTDRPSISGCSRLGPALISAGRWNRPLTAASGCDSLDWKVWRSASHPSRRDTRRHWNSRTTERALRRVSHDIHSNRPGNRSTSCFALVAAAGTGRGSFSQIIFRGGLAQRSISRCLAARCLPGMLGRGLSRPDRGLREDLGGFRAGRGSTSTNTALPGHAQIRPPPPRSQGREQPAKGLRGTPVCGSCRCGYPFRPREDFSCAALPEPSKMRQGKRSGRASFPHHGCLAAVSAVIGRVILVEAAGTPKSIRDFC